MNVATSASSRTKRPVLPPPFPAVAVQLIQQMQDPDASAADVGRLIELDPSLTASLLRLVNSPFFGMRRQIAGVSEAVTVLGMSAVRRMVMSVAVVTPLRKPEIDPAFAKSQWHHTVSCAAIARRLIADDAAAAELAFTAGLLHDIGQVHLMQLHGPAYAALHAESPDTDWRGIEAERFGQPHDWLGADLLEAWGLPQVIADAARLHHAAPPLTHLTLVQQAVCVANRLAGTPAEAAQAAVMSPKSLVPVKQAVEEARAEIDTMASLLNA
ncbi:HDOD domain-containing protein [Piscinibacter terrae]|uniref:HDOD domain-containing protein n=1 Tax=Piscinibacter terrae TaxID=2496871 RepID=A0A3N7HKD6_9BURK|nr:HDOD domain-containing protein [Albitalea terrae]RQP22547.1 HDOD domain-containing protein [Albitalea terrae]